MSPRSTKGGDRDDADTVEDVEDVDEAEPADESDVIDGEAAEDGGEFDDDDDQDLRPAAAPTLTGRLTQAFTRPRSTNGAGQADTLSEKEKAAAIRQIDSTERRVGYIGALLTIAIAAVAFVPYISNPKKKTTDDFNRVGKHCPPGSRYATSIHQCTKMITFPRSHWVEELLIALLFAAFIAVATWYGRRSLVAFSLLFGGLAVVSLTGSILGIVYIGAGGWLMVRAYRVQKYGTTNAKEVAAIASEQRAERKAASGTSTRGTRSSARSTNAKGSSASSKNKNKNKKAQPTEGKAPPQANKRYTPKAPPRKRPVPPSD